MINLTSFVPSYLKLYLHIHFSQIIRPFIKYFNALICISQIDNRIGLRLCFNDLLLEAILQTKIIFQCRKLNFASTMASKFLMPPLAISKRQMASMAARQSSAAPTHQLEVSLLWLIRFECF